jgi:hypothetical protein
MTTPTDLAIADFLDLLALRPGTRWDLRMCLERHGYTLEHAPVDAALKTLRHSTQVRELPDGRWALREGRTHG